MDLWIFSEAPVIVFCVSFVAAVLAAYDCDAGHLPLFCTKAGVPWIKVLK